MDAVRFGRALGVGARQAAKTLVTAVDAATTENPSNKGVKASANTGRVPAATRTETPTTPVAPVARTVVETAAKTVSQARGTKEALRRGRKRFGQAALEPFIRLSGVLGLELAGVFFGIFALFALGTVWRLRGDWHINAAGHRQLMFASAMLAIFGYFCVTSFVRARRREKGR
jgi:hypothetical protein